MPTTRLLAVLPLATAALTLGVAPADADPNGDAFDLLCTDGRTYPVTTNGSGEFTPAHDTTSTSILVPTSFHGFTASFYDADGHFLGTETDSTVATKGMSGRQRGTTTSCTYSFQETFVDESGEAITIVGSGGVTGFVTPLR